MKYIVGAYATAPSLGVNDKAQEIGFYEQLIQSIPEMQGLEIPFFGKEIHSFGSDFLLDIIQSGWNNVLSCIPGTMASLVSNPKFGLASDDEVGRSEAIAMHNRANQMLHRVNERFGRKTIIAVQMATAPSRPVSGVSSSVDSFRRSMDEMLSWDWGGAKIVIEHCDASISGQQFEKGFFSIEKEIQILETLSTDYNLGILINWARSAIEGRSPDKPIEHLELAVKHELLSGLIFSGASSNDERYGQWNDTHMPFSDCYGATYFEKNSLLTQDNIANTLNTVEVDKLDYLGIKLLSMPIETSTVARRVGINRDAISILNKILCN